MKGFLFGMGLGLGLGILFAPESGEVSRRKLKQYATDALDALTEEFSDHAEDSDQEDDHATIRVGVGAQTEAQEREEMLDKTLADSFPSSDPPSSIPDPRPGEREVA
jgi:gas vesicle protein